MRQESLRPTNANLPSLGRSHSVPSYDRSALRPSIIHIGVGGFHRAHLATYVHELASAGNTEWAIVGAGVLPGDDAIAQALWSQDCLYTLVTRGPTSTDVTVIGSIIDFVLAYPDPTELIHRIADPRTQIVSLTITEGGYPVDDRTGHYVATSPNAGQTSTFGILAAGLALRRSNGAGGLSVVSCDNIIGNGDVARASVLGETDHIGSEVSQWVADHVSFPNSMVDRITPATTDADRRWLVDQHGIDDAWPVTTEPFRQWVLEDTFFGERPPFDDLDIILTDDVEPYELMKLRLLNAGHSCLAYLAALLGESHVHTAMTDPLLRRYIECFLAHEGTPAVPAVAGVDLRDYRIELIERFSNPAIADQIHRLCLDGSAKLPKFLLPTIRINLASSASIEFGAMAVAGWCTYLQGVADNGASIELAPDPHLATARRFAVESSTDPARFLEFEPVFGTDLGTNDRFRTSFVESLLSIRARGVRSTLEELLNDHEGHHGP